MNRHKVKVGEFLIRVKDLVPIIDNEDYKLVTIKLYHKGVQLRKCVKGTEIQADKMSRVKSGQFILSGIDARNGAFGIIPSELDGAVVTNDFWHFEIDTKIISNEYFLWLTSTPYFDDICKKASDGTTNRIRLQADRFFSQELMIPDIRDQHKVVNELKTTSDKIKSLEVEYHFQLTQIENLNQAILQEAVQGKLVPQDKNDEPASELLKRIKSEKAKSGKKEKLLPPIKLEEIPFEIPERWVWSKLSEICDNITDGTHQTPTYFKSGYIFLSSKNVTSGKIDWNEVKYIDEKQHLEMYKRIAPRLNDILLAKNGTTGVAALVDREVTFDIYVSLALLRPLIGIYPNYLLYFVNSSAAKLQFNKRLRGIGVPNLHLNEIREVTIPLPPFEEQIRIVAEIEKQLAKTKQIKEHIIANQLATQQLLKALLHGAFEPKLAGEVEEKEELNN